MVEELLEAAKAGNLERIRYLVKEVGLPVDSRYPPEGPTPLYWAACNGNVNVCSWLVDHQANPNFTLPKSGSTPLHAAADRGNYSCVLLLICKGAHINQQTSNNLDTALHLAAYRGYSPICSLLLDHGANVLLQNKQGRTPLDEACITGKVNIVQMICKKQADSVCSKHFSSKAFPKFTEETYHKSDSQKEETRADDGYYDSDWPQASHQSVDFEDRIGIQQFDQRRAFSPSITGPMCSSDPIPPKVTHSKKHLSAPETHQRGELSKTFSSLQSGLVEQFERLAVTMADKERQLVQLKTENKKLRAELKKYTQKHSDT